MRLQGIALLVIVVLISARTSFATPNLSARYGQDCHLCHVNPTGGGMRNSYVTQYIGPMELPLKPLSAHEKTRWPNPKITDQISIGTDLRFLYVAPDNIATESGVLDNTFYQMQGDVYLAFEPDPQFTIYLDRGLRGGYEVFVLARVLPMHGYLKAGQFVPDLGWRWDDHTHYTREKIGLDFPGATEAGIELGLSPGDWALTTGVYNSSQGAALDNNSQKAIVGRVQRRLHFGALQMALGGSTRWDRGRNFRERLWGLQAQANWRSVSYIGDFYGRRTEFIDAGAGRVWAWLFSQEIEWRPRQGLDLFLGYDFLDSDLDVKSGAQTQVSLGTRIYVRYYFEIEPVLRYEEGEVAAGRSTNSRFELLLHAFY
jgi:hypothetical protein